VLPTYLDSEFGGWASGRRGGTGGRGRSVALFQLFTDKLDCWEEDPNRILIVASVICVD